MKLNRKGTLLPVAFAFCWFSFAIFGFSHDISQILYYKVYLKNLATAMSMSMVNQCYYFGVGYEWDAEEQRYKVGSYDKDNQNVIIMPDPNTIEGAQFLEEQQIIGVTKNGLVVRSANILDVYKTQTDVRTGKVEYAGDNFFDELIREQPKKSDGKDRIGVYRMEDYGSATNYFSPSETFTLIRKDCKINRGYFDMDEKERDSYSYILYSEKDQSTFNRFIHGRDQYNGEVEIYLVGRVKLWFLGGSLFNINSQDSVRITTYAISQPRILQYDTDTVAPTTGNTDITLDDANSDK